MKWTEIPPKLNSSRDHLEYLQSWFHRLQILLSVCLSVCLSICPSIQPDKLPVASGLELIGFLCFFCVARGAWALDMVVSCWLRRAKKIPARQGRWLKHRPVFLRKFLQCPHRTLVRKYSFWACHSFLRNIFRPSTLRLLHVLHHSSQWRPCRWQDAHGQSPVQNNKTRYLLVEPHPLQVLVCAVLRPPLSVVDGGTNMWYKSWWQ